MTPPLMLPEAASFPKVVPVLILPEQVLLPQMTIPFPRARLNLSSPSATNPSGLFLALPELHDHWRTHSRDIPPDDSDFEVGCLTQVDLYSSTDSATGLVILRGVCRARFQLIDPWSDPKAGGSGFAAIERMPDRDDPALDTDYASLRQELIQKLVERCPDLAIREMSGLLECELPLGHLCDLAAPALGLLVEELRDVLVESRVNERCQMLLRLARTGPTPGGSLPNFGWN